MLRFCLTYAVRILLVAILSILPLALFAHPVFADRTINSVTLNGSSSVTVAPSASITASVTVTTDGRGATNDWNSTSWNISDVHCENHADHTETGTYTESFSITAPNSAGTYSVSFIAYKNDACSTNASTTYTLTNGIIVESSPTSTPTPTPVPGAPTATPGPTATSAPGQPTATPTSTSSTSSTATVTYPSVSLNTYTPNPTNIALLTFQGLASIEQGTIALTEYTYTDGATWIQAQPADGNFNGKDEHFTFTTPRLAEGTYTVKVRAKSGTGTLTQDGGYSSQIVTIATTPPQVTLDAIAPNPTKDQTPTLTGTTVAKLAAITKVEVSIDDGKSWQSAKRSTNTFSFTPEKLEDGNYRIRARALDSAGNVGLSDTQTLIIDTIPPIIGGGMQSMGPQILTPDGSGRVSVVAGTETTIAMSMKGGVTEARITTDSDSFKLSPKTGTNIWIGNIKFDPSQDSGQAQIKPLIISATDGAGNSTERTYNTLTVENSGTVEDSKTKQVIEHATVSVYYLEPVSATWIVWEGDSYGQHNPQKTDSNGSYSFMVPAGRYYIEAKAAGYKTLQSEIITVSQTTILNFPLPLISKPKIEFTLPFFGKVVLTVPSFSPPETFSPTHASPKPESAKPHAMKPGTPAPGFSLPNPEGRQISLAAYRGKKLLLTFIAPWSSLSLEQAPFLSDVATQAADNQAILVVSLQETLAATQALMKKGNYGFPVVADKDGVTAAAYNVTILPHHVFIDTNGRIQDSFTGVLSCEELMKKLSDVP